MKDTVLVKRRFTSPTLWRKELANLHRVDLDWNLEFYLPGKVLRLGLEKNFRDWPPN